MKLKTLRTFKGDFIISCTVLLFDDSISEFFRDGCLENWGAGLRAGGGKEVAGLHLWDGIVMG